MTFLWIHSLVSTLIFVLTLLFVSSILRARRAAGSTLAWLFLICAFPYIGIPVYLLLSSRKIGRSVTTDRSTQSLAQEETIRHLSPTQRVLHSSGMPSAKENDIVELLPTGVAAYAAVMRMIEGANETIYITTFIFGNDPVGIAFVDALARKAEAGIEVRIIIDSLGATLIHHPSFRRLVKAGGKTVYFMPLVHVPFRGRTNLRNHRKLIVTDGRYALLGGMNLAKEYLGPNVDEKRWIDLSIQIHGGCVNDIQQIFLNDWDYANHKKEREIAGHTQAIEPNGILAQVVASGPDVSEDTIYDVLLSAIYDAKTTIQVITPYFIPDESLTKALQLATKRGVEVKIIIPRRSNHKLADIARGSFIRQLEQSGAKIFFYPKMIHAKVVMVDQTLAILGSANFDMRSLLLNYELGLIIYSKEKLIEIERWIIQISDQTSSQLPKLTFLREMSEGIGRVIGPML